MALYRAAWTGVAAGVNDWLAARTIPNPARKRGGKGPPYIAILYQRSKYKEFKSSMAEAFAGTTLGERFVDMRLVVRAPKRFDSDAFYKPVGDALEAAGVLRKDNQIRDHRLVRYYGKYRDPVTIVVELYATTIRERTWAETAEEYGI